MLYAEWIDYMNAYRLYDDPIHPQQTVAYEDDLEAAEKRAIEEGYSGLLLDLCSLYEANMRKEKDDG